MRRTILPLIVTVLVGCVGAWGFITVLAFLQLNAERRDEAAAVETLRSSLALLGRAESAARGYAIEGDTIYLGAFNAATSRIGVTFETIRRSPWPPVEVAKLLADGRSKLVGMEKIVALQGSGQHDAAIATIRAGDDFRLMLKFRGRAESLIESVTRPQQARELESERSAFHLLVAMPIVGILAPSLIIATLRVAFKAERDRAGADAATEHARNDSRRQANLLNALSHDIKTPLNAIGLQAQTAEMLIGILTPQIDKRNQVEKLEEYLRNIRETVKASKIMLEEYLECARAEREGPNPKCFCLRTVLETAAGMNESQAEDKGLFLRVDCEETLFARTDQALLNRVIMNLVENAIKYTRRGGVLLRAMPQDMGVRVEVVDTGIGVDPAIVPKLFNDFVQGDNPERNAVKGFGLGLSNSRRIVGTLDGKIGVSANPGGGSIFWVELPDLAYRS